MVAPVIEAVPAATASRVQRRQGLRRFRLLLHALVGLVLCLGCGLRWLARGNQLSLDWDEGISYLVSTCHTNAYAAAVEPGSELYDRFVPATLWRGLLQSDGSLCMAGIWRDLSANDVHPPLYFWLLHGWTVAFGRSLRSSMALNLLFFAIGLLALHSLARRALRSRVEALAVCAIASSNAVAVQASLEVRPYALLGALTALCAWLVVVCCEKRAPARGWYAGLMLGTAAGMLTHVLFWFALPVLGLYALLRLAPRAPARLLALGVAVASGAAVALLSFPFVEQWRRRNALEDAHPRGVDWSGPSLAAVLEFLQQPLALGPAWLGLFASAALALHFAWLRRLGAHGVPVRWHHGWEMSLVCVGLVLSSVLPFALGWSPPHAIGVKYMACAWALLPVLPVLLLRALGRFRALGLVLFCALNAAPALASGWAQRAQIALTEYRVPDRRVVVSALGRTHFPRLLLALEPEAEVKATDRSRLLSELERAPERQEFSFAACKGTQDAASSKLRRAFRKHYELRSQQWAGVCWTLYRYAPRDAREQKRRHHRKHQPE